MLLTAAAVLFTVINGQSGVRTAAAALTGGDVVTEAECRWCHCDQPADSPLYMPNRHHKLLTQPAPSGIIYNCFGTNSCHVPDPTSISGMAPFRDCIKCHTSTPDPVGHHRLSNFGCLQCHEMRPDSPAGTYLINWCGNVPHPGYDPPVAQAGPDQSVYVGQTVQLDGSGSYDPELPVALSSYIWDFGDGTPPVSGIRVSHTYTQVGCYFPTLTVSNSVCATAPTATTCLQSSDSAAVVVSQPLVAPAPPVASVSPATITAAPGAAVNFDLSGTTDPAGVIVVMIMDFGDGQQISSPLVKQLTHTYANSGDYTSKLSVYNYNSLLSQASTAVHIAVPVPPVASISPSAITAAPGATVNFDVSGSKDPDGTITSMTMDFGDGQKVTSSLVGQISHVYASAGDYTARLTVYDNSNLTSQATAAVHVTVPVVLPAAPSSLSAPSKTYNSVTLKWVDNSNNEQGFYIERSPNVTPPVWTRIGQVAANTTTFVVSGLSKNTAYKFRVLSYNSVGTSPSNILSVTTVNK